MSETGSPSARLTGGCQCGAVRFAATGAPEEVSICYCRMCQKASGGPFMALARFPSDAVAWTRGQPSIFNSSTVASRGFCPTCGTPLTYQWRPNAVSLTTGSFDDPAAVPPTTRSGIEGRLDWTDTLASMLAETTDDQPDDAPKLKDRSDSRQHPDHDT